MSQTTTSLSFQPWTRESGDKTGLQDVLARVNLERGHFRNITEASLLEEIAAEGGIDSSETEDEDEEQDEPDTKRQAATTREELYMRKHEMLEHVRIAQNDILMSLDFISLLESKYAPGQARVSMSEALKQSGVPVGSLAVDVWDQQAMPKDDARRAQDQILANKVRLESLQQSAEDLFAAAARLQDNVRKETQFWEEILSVSEKGWSVSRIPRSYLLGVHFGFRGSAPEFATRNVAALIADADGGVALERGIGTRPKAVRAIIRQSGKVIGSSRLPSLSDNEEAPLEVRIRHARDSLYDEELFHEMIRETRSLTSAGVHMRGSTILLPASIQEAAQLELELLSLDDDNGLPADAEHQFDLIAHAALLTSRLLLGQAHRDKMKKKRDAPQPLTANKDAEKRQPLSLLRPLMLLLQHCAEVTRLNTYIDNMSRLLRQAGASAESQLTCVGLVTPPNDSISTETIIDSFTRPMQAEGNIWISATDERTSDLKLGIETSRTIPLGSAFTIQSPDGKRITLPKLDTLYRAADDYLTLELGQVLKEVAGTGWDLDRREGKLSRADPEAGKELAWFAVTHSDASVTLHLKTAEGRMQVVWKLDGTGESKTMKEIWQDLVDKA